MTNHSSQRAPSMIAPFLVGAAVGGLAGAVAGALLGQQTARLAAAAIALFDRRLTDADRERVRFESLSQ